MNYRGKIPEHWEIKRLDEVGDIFSGGTPSTKDEDNWGEGIIWITPSDLTGYLAKTIYKGKKSISKLGLSRSSARLMPKGSVLFSSRAPIGYVVIAGTELCTNQGFKSIIPNEKVISDYLFHFLKYSKSHVQSVASGTTFKEISARAFGSLKMPVPPLNEQQLIVDKIEELFSELDAGRRQLEAVKKQLETYRQSVFHQAFTGRLMGTGRDLSYGTILSSSAATLIENNFSQLPEGWHWVKLEKVCKKIGDIDHKMPKVSSEGYPYISTRDITAKNKIDFTKSKLISKEDYITLSMKIKPEYGDIIFPRYGTIGKNVLIDFHREFLVSYSCAIIKPDQDLVDSKYLFYYTLSPIASSEIRKYTVETTQANIGITSIKKFLFPCPPLKEQKYVIQEIESRLSVCDKLEETIETCLQQSEALEQSILKQAFEGKLVKSLINRQKSQIK